MTDPRERYTFVCPDCAGTITVNEATRGALVEHGCVRCGSTVPPNAFVSI